MNKIKFVCQKFIEIQPMHKVCMAVFILFSVQIYTIYAISNVSNDLDYIESDCDHAHYCQCDRQINDAKDEIIDEISSMTLYCR